MKNINEVAEKLSSWLVAIIRGFVSNPSDIKIEVKEDEMGLLFLVKVNKSDMGKLIGMRGQHSNALRLLLRSAALSNNIRVSMKIEEPDN